MPEKRTNTHNYIQIKGAKVHNLKNISLKIPRDKFIVITGLSGSGKSSLAFDTLYAEGQRRYVESLSSYARQFMGRINKPEVESITGIPPAIAIEQRVKTHNPRSTVGTSTEIYDYLRLLYARTGITVSPVSGQEVKKHTVSDVAGFILSFNDGTPVIILSPAEIPAAGDIARYLEIKKKEGATRMEVNGRIKKISELTEDPVAVSKLHSLNLVIDRIMVANDNDIRARIADSVEVAFAEGKGKCLLKTGNPDEEKVHHFSNLFEMDGIEFEEPSVHMFSFNNPLGACPVCEGYGKIIGVDEDLVVPDKSLSVYNDAIACWRGAKMKKWKERLIYNASKFNFPIHKPYIELTDEQKKLLWNGNRYFYGLDRFFKYLEKKKYKIQYRVMLSRYMGKTKCPECGGTRLRKEASWVKVGKKTIQELVTMSIDSLHKFFNEISLSPHEEKIAGRILEEIRNRINFLRDVGLGYLSLNRLSSTLSGGESQRINLATSLGSSLVGSLYILDEPSIGLHPRDTSRLVKVLRELQKTGNTVIVVEHEEEVIRASDLIVDIGPLAGRNGGEIIFCGDHSKLLKEEKSLTARYLTGREKIPVPPARRIWNSYIEITGAKENNLKSINVRIPLNILTVVTGVSGSGKSSLVRDILYPALSRLYNGKTEKPGDFGRLACDTGILEGVEFVDQNPIGKSSRSNPVTYVKAYDEIRKLFAAQNASRLNKYQPSHFSFNTRGGRCEECEGEGKIKVEMQFMADVTLVCESCKGQRFREEILEVRYRGKNIYDVLEMTVNEAMEFFDSEKTLNEHKIVEKLEPLQSTGLGYVKLGQSSATLSGGENQRVKLASFIGKEKRKPTLFIFDEPTTGLHFHDIGKLLDSFSFLIKKGHSILIVEHNPEIIKCADWVIDLGPEGGDSGGYIMFEGTPEELACKTDSHTGCFIAKKL